MANVVYTATGPKKINPLSIPSGGRHPQQQKTQSGLSGWRRGLLSAMMNEIYGNHYARRKFSVVCGENPIAAIPAYYCSTVRYVLVLYNDQEVVDALLPVCCTVGTCTALQATGREVLQYSYEQSSIA